MLCKHNTFKLMLCQIRKPQELHHMFIRYRLGLVGCVWTCWVAGGKRGVAGQPEHCLCHSWRQTAFLPCDVSITSTTGAVQATADSANVGALAAAVAARAATCLGGVRLVLGVRPEAQMSIPLTCGQGRFILYHQNKVANIARIFTEL